MKLRAPELEVYREPRSMRARRKETSSARRTSCRTFFRTLSRIVPTRQPEPVALIDKRNRQQQRSQHNETYDAVSAVQFRYIVEKDFADGESDQDQRLPADECRTPPEAHRHQHSAVGHPQGGVSEVARDFHMLPIPPGGRVPLALGTKIRHLLRVVVSNF